jgi:formylglycine-generating enzyme required for sulfatase activity
VFATSASAPAGEATMALSRTDADTNPQPLSFVTPATSIRTRRPPARPLPSRKMMVLVGGGVAALVVSLVTTAIMLSRSPTPATNSQTAATSNRPNVAASKPKGPPPPLAIAPFDAAAAKKHQQAWADYLGMPVEKEIKLPGNVPLVMVLVPPGEFMRSEDGQPQFKVRITKPFYMGKYEVTQAQWQAVMGTNPSKFKDDPANLVERVSWDDTQPFLTKLNDTRLVNQWRFVRPTEAQWEYACRAGTTTVFPFGNSEIILAEYAWYQASSQNRAHAVGQLKPNAFGLYDMLGNVWEWCDDWHMGGYYAQAPQDDPSGPTIGSARVLRGGYYQTEAGGCRPAARTLRAPSFRQNDLGFRLAMTPSDEFLSRLDGNQSTSVATKGTPATSAPVANAASSDIASAVQGLGKGPPPPLAIAPFDAAMAKKHQQAWADYLGMPVELEIKLPGNVPLIMVLIPPGEFMRSEDGQPQFKVQITKPFYLGKYEVTQAQWQAVMGSNPSMLKDDSSNPVEQVSWDDTDPFLTKLNDARLVNQWRFGRPTEAQWEYACRAGTTTLFPFGDSEVILPKHAWYLASSRGKPHLVGQHEPNAFELRDMLGNVWEWCDDWYMEAYYAQAPKYDPTGPTEGSDRGIRGGSYADTAGNCRPAYRSRLAPSFRGNNVGIRLALSFVGVPDKPGKEKR